MPTPAEEEAARQRQAAELAAQQEAQRQVSASTLRDGMAKDQLQPKPVIPATQAQQDFEQRQRGDLAAQQRLEAARLNDDPARRAQDWLREETSALVAERTARDREANALKYAERRQQLDATAAAQALPAAPQPEQLAASAIIEKAQQEARDLIERAKAAASQILKPVAPQLSAADIAEREETRVADVHDGARRYPEFATPSSAALSIVLDDRARHTHDQAQAEQGRAEEAQRGVQRYAERRATVAREDYQPLREQSDYRQRRAAVEQREVSREETDARASRANSASSKKTNERGGMGD